MVPPLRLLALESVSLRAAPDQGLPTSTGKRMGELVIVTWEDTTNIAAWQTPEEVAEWAGERGWICQNIGWLVYQDEHCVVIAGRRAWDQQRHLGLAERIPRKAILEMNNMAGVVIPDPGKWQCECPDGEHKESGRGYDLTAHNIDGDDR